MQYNEIVRVSPRYARSINLERDAASRDALEGYILTSTAKGCLERILYAVHDKNGQRAWTLTGPYGSGKSAFALFLAGILGPSNDTLGRAADSIARSQAPDISKKFFGKRDPGKGFCIIKLSGAQEPMLPAFLAACCRDLGRYVRRAPAKELLRELDDLRLRSLDGRAVSTTSVVEIVARLSNQLVTDKTTLGTFIVIDELGKFLDYAANSPDGGDVFLLQQLAESVAPSEAKLSIVTVLHQSFDRYAAGLRASIREEWAKIQGRFEDVAFQEPPDQILNLVAAGISHKPEPSPAVTKMRQQVKGIAESAFQLGLAPRGFSKHEFVAILEDCAPLHPLTVLVLSRLCRKFGQNQRSLFSFLVSREPHGFAQFLERPIAKEALPLYTLANLFDYVAESLGEALTIGESGTKWAAAQSALDRAADSTGSEMELLKTVGLLNAIGSAGELRSTPALLRTALGRPQAADLPELQSLVARSLLIERKYNDTVGLWDGSDIDLDERIREATARLPQTAAVAAKLGSLWKPRPIIAKRHSYRIGTLRYFTVALADITTDTKQLATSADADGLLVYCLPASQEDRQSLELRALTHSAANPGIVFALPRDVDGVRDAMYQLDILRWVEANTPELQSDAVARKELRSRVTWVENRLRTEILKVFHPGEISARETFWFYAGKVAHITSERRLSDLLSSVCDEVYEKTPVIQNELLNRRQLSSAAAAARRNLITAMIQRAEEYRLGFEGSPPEVSMYRSLLEDSGIHRSVEGTHGFTAPLPSSRLLPVWEYLDALLEHAQEQRLSVSKIFEELTQPPYGVKAGPLPVLFWAYLMANDTEIALYEDGIFTPELTVEAVERMLRAPQKFEIRRYRVSGVRRDLFVRLGQVLNAPLQTDRANLVELMRPLYRFFHRLPAYTRQTKRLSESAIAVRQALSDAREPDVLLFSELPKACQLAPFTTEMADPNALTIFLTTIRGALMELQQSYETLLQDLRQLLFDAMGVSGEDARSSLRLQAEDVFESTVEPRLRAFSNNLADANLSDTHWTEAIAAMIIGKIPKAWTDADRARFDVLLGELSRSFRHTLVLVRERYKQRQKLGANADVFRYSILDLQQGETAEVLSILPEERREWEKATVELRGILEATMDQRNPKLTAAALGSVLREYLVQLKNPESSGLGSDLKLKARGTGNE